MTSTNKLSADVLLCHQYFATLSECDWETLGELCHREITYTLRGAAPIPTHVHGRAAFLDMSRSVFEKFDGARFSDVRVKAMAGALGMYVATYRGTWINRAGDTRSDDGRVVFQIARDKITHVAVLLSDDQLEILAKEWTGLA
jgi:ketosteroid isomerase-like protein